MVQNREAELQRTKMMYERNLIAEKEYEKSRTELEVAKAQREGKKSKLALLISQPKAEELAIKEAELASLEAEIAFLRTQIAASTVLSPIDGEAARVERSGVLVEVADLDPIRLQLLVHENDIADVRLDAKVSLKVRSLPFDTFQGRVAKIADLADTLGDGRRFLVTTELANTQGLLKPGMSGFAKIGCGKRPILSLITRRVIQFFRVEFWSWW
jgi:multidrug efflux pump subunit AcrA (membrane-fusion protein)